MNKPCGHLCSESDMRLDVLDVLDEKMCLCRCYDPSARLETPSALLSPQV
jgi:hypothetical protein